MKAGEGWMAERFSVPRNDGWLICWRPWNNEPNAVVMEFELLEISREEIEPEPGLVFMCAETLEETKDPSVCKPQIAGSVKWDGCSNWEFNSDQCLFHFCGISGVEALGGALRRCYEIAAKHLSSFDRSLADMEPEQR